MEEFKRRLIALNDEALALQTYYNHIREASKVETVRKRIAIELPLIILEGSSQAISSSIAVITAATANGEDMLACCTVAEEELEGRGISIGRSVSDNGAMAWKVAVTGSEQDYDDISQGQSITVTHHLDITGTADFELNVNYEKRF